jgi:hypothetical protein
MGQTGRSEFCKNNAEQTKHDREIRRAPGRKIQKLEKYSAIKYKITRIIHAKLDKMFKFNRKFIEFS